MKIYICFQLNQYLQFITLHLYLDTPHNVLEYSSFHNLYGTINYTTKDPDLEQILSYLIMYIKHVVE